MSDFDRLRWRCRRGLLELDLVLTRFLAQGYTDLDARQREVFVALLAHADNELWTSCLAGCTPITPRKKPSSIGCARREDPPPRLRCAAPSPGGGRWSREVFDA